jgi:hypothetical protein
MRTETVQRVALEGLHCSMTMSQPCPGLVLLRIEGSDIGEFGEMPFRALEGLLPHDPCQLFIDSRSTKGASIEVSQTWAEWLGARRGAFTRITMLCGSRFIVVTAEFVRRFAGLSGLMWLTTDPDAFDEALATVCGGFDPGALDRPAALDEL